MTEPLDIVMNERLHRFEATLDGETAFADYQLSPGVLTLPHTVVPAAFAGRGVGGRLAQAALGYARAHGLKVKPTCSFMAAYVGKHREWDDVIHEDFRAAPAGGLTRR